MGRNPKIRVSYFDDANFIVRLIRAIEMDTSRPLAWKREVIRKAQELSTMLMNAPGPEAEESKKRGR